LLAFVRFDRGGEPRWWQWLVASLLPLVHVVLAPLALIWFATAVAQWCRLDPARRTHAGPKVFAIGALANVAWYARSAPLVTQLFPHVRYGGFRYGGSLSGFLDTAASPIASVPTWILHGLIVSGAIAIVIAAIGARRRGSLLMVLPAAI